ncbi:MAG: caspase family protein [Myxococcota bacterium]
MRAALLGTLVASLTAAAAEPVRLLVSIGNDLGDPQDTPLAWAEADAQRVASLFVDLGDVAPERAVVVLGQRADVLREKLAEVRGRVDELVSEGREVMLVVYYSGHARAGQLHLGGTSFPLAGLREYLERSPAKLKLAIVDACDSGVLARKKGGAPGPEFDVAMATDGVRGLALLTSSGPAEASQELSTLKGGLFTHHVLTGLRGDADADADGTVTLAEVYAYAFRRTVEGAARGGQHPAFDLDLAGSGQWALSAPRRARSTIVLPAEAEGTFVVSSQPRPDVVAEVVKTKGRVLRLAVPPGRYLVQKRLGLQVGLATLELPFGGQGVVEERRLELRGFGEVALKGGVFDIRPWAAWVSGSLGSQSLAATGLDWSVGVGLRRGVDAFFVGASLTGAHRAYRGVALSIAETGLSLRAEGGFRVLSLPVVPVFGLTAGGRLLHQARSRDEQALLGEVMGTPPLAPLATLGVDVGPLAGVELPLGERFLAQARATGLLRWLPSQEQPPVTFAVEGSLLVGVRF